MNRKLLCFLAICFFCTTGKMASAQTMKDVFIKETPITYLGIDFSRARLLDIGNPDDIRNRLYGSINQLVLDEPKKFDIAGAFRKSFVENYITPVNENNLKADAGKILSTNQADFNRLRQNDIEEIVDELNISRKTSVGVLFVMEAMRKTDKKGDAAIWVVFIDMREKKILVTERLEVKAAGGFGFRNFWASTIKDLIDEIDSHKYKDWKKQYGN
jgi:hypothetical protein